MELIEWLKFLDNIEPGLKVQKFIEFPRPWIGISDPGFSSYISTYGLPNHREILKQEIVIDVDTDNVEDGVKHADLIEYELRKKHIRFMRYKSGGMGQHFHIWFFPKEMKKLLEKYDTGAVRTSIIRYLCTKKLLHHLQSHICLHNKTLIQIENVKHRKGGTKKLISQWKGANSVPKIISKILDDKYIAIQERRKRLAKLPKPKGKINCIKFLEGKKVNGLTFTDYGDGYNRAMFFLTSYYIHQWNYKKLFAYLTKYKIAHKVKLNSSIKGMITSNKGHASCPSRQQFFEELGVIKVCENCPYNDRLKFTNK